MDHRDIIIDLVNREQLKVMVEIGVDRGQLTFKVQRKCPSITKYIAVDPWEVYEGKGAGSLAKVTTEEWEERFIAVEKVLASDSRFNIFRMCSEEAIQFVTDETIDIVFIDANHTYEDCKNDIEIWLPKLRCYGWLTGDDYSFYPGVKEAVDELLSERKLLNNRVWAFQKKMLVEGKNHYEDHAIRKMPMNIRGENDKTTSNN